MRIVPALLLWSLVFVLHLPLALLLLILRPIDRMLSARDQAAPGRHPGANLGRLSVAANVA